MSHSGIERWLRKIGELFGRILGTIVRPWTALIAVKANQVDIITALSSQQADIANALVQIRKIRQDLDRIDISVTGHEESIRDLRQPAEGGRRSDGQKIKN